jgi:hypothetical protein
MKIQTRSEGIDSAADAVTIKFSNKEELIGLVNALGVLPDGVLEIVLGEDTLIADPDKGEQTEA